MKHALALLLLAAPLPAQTATQQNIVVNVVVTFVKGGTTTPTPVSAPVSTPTPLSPIVVSPVPVSPVTSTPTPTPTPTPVSSPTGTCVDNYPAAVQSMADVSNDIVQAEQAFAAALSSKTINAAAYATGIKTLSLVNVDNSDTRDLVRVGGPTSVITQNITFVNAEIGTLPSLIGTNTQLTATLTKLKTAMQASLATAGTDVAQSTCVAPVP